MNSIEIIINHLTVPLTSPRDRPDTGTSHSSLVFGQHVVSTAGIAVGARGETVWRSVTLLMRQAYFAASFDAAIRGT